MNFGRFRAISQTGAGRDGVRFAADDQTTGERVELRTLGSVASDSERWPHVSKRLKSVELLDHPTAKRIIELDLQNDPPFAAFEKIEAASLADCHDSRGADRTAGVGVLLELARGLAAAHRLGLSHGDLSPHTVRLPISNIPKVDWSRLDVGIRFFPNDELADVCRPPEASTPGYEPDAAGDLFAYGVLLVWHLAGTLPWESEFKLHDPALDSLAKRLLSIDPLERPSARDCVQALEVWQSIAGAGMTEDLSSSDLTRISGLELIPPAARHVTSPASKEEMLRERGQLGRFKLYEKLGQGGMGAVYRGVDMADGREVAIKILSATFAARPESLKRFLKEARLLAEVNSPHVTNFIELNQDDGIHFLALEFVRGSNLADWISTKGKLDEKTALSIIADVSRALAVAHEHSIIHRDVKPENILILLDHDHAILDHGMPRVKLSDFGLARHVVENESLEVTQAGTILGTPLYMSPEQCVGGSIDARSDVYSTGATLFHLLAGRPPFLASSPLAVISMHRNDPPPELKSLNEAISDAVSEIVAKTLAKSPNQRYADASAMLLDLERLLRGEPTGISVHPRLPEGNPKDLVEFDWRFDLEASPSELWPHVSNTERLNKAVGIPAVEFHNEEDSEGGVRRFGEFSKMGMKVAWREHPFEWVEGRRLGVVREYPDGPFRWFVSIVDLAPKAGGGTTLTHKVRISSRGLLGRTLAAVEVGVKGKRAVTGVYHRIDATVSGKLGRDPVLDPFEAPTELPREKKAKLEDWLDSLLKRGIDLAVVERFGEFLERAPAQEVSRIRPLALARRLGVNPDGLVTVCLLGANEGILSLLWDLLCPVCRIPSQVIGSLRALKEHGNCQACQIDYDIDFANSVELIFRVDPAVRNSDVAVYCIGGPAHSPHVAAQARIGPHERVDIDIELGEGHYRFRGPQLPYQIDFRTEPKAPIDRWDLSLGKPPGPDLPRVLRSGPLVFSLSNDLDREIVVRIERTAAREDALTAARASTLALFRELFPGEMLEPGQLVNLATATFVVTELQDAAKLYEEMGDAKAFGLIHEHFRRIDAIVRREGGALIKTVEEGVFAAFPDPVAAVRAAISFAEAVDSDKAAHEAHLALRVAVHRGPAMVATLNDHLDYFGTTVRVATALPAFCPPNEIVLTQAVATDPGVSEVLQLSKLSSQIMEVSIHGLHENYISRFYR